MTRNGLRPRSRSQAYGVQPFRDLGLLIRLGRSAEHKTEGLLKLIAHKNGRVVGASILGTNAGELAHWWVIAIQQGLKLRNLAQTFAPYPTWGELNKAAASEFSKPLLTGAFTRNAARIMSWFP